MSVSEVSLFSYSAFLALSIALLSTALAIRLTFSMRSQRRAFERMLSEAKAQGDSERSVMNSRIIALEGRREVDQLYFEHLDRLIGRRLHESSEENLDRLYAAIDVRLLECAREIWDGPFSERVRQRLADALLEELGRQALDLDPRIRDMLVTTLKGEAERFVHAWVHKGYNDLTGNAKAFADTVWSQIGSQAAVLDPKISAAIVEKLVEEAGRFTNSWIHRSYTDLNGHGKAFADAVWAEIGRQAQSLDPSVNREIVVKLAAMASQFVETWVKRSYNSLSDNAKCFADAVWAEVGALAEDLPPPIRDAIADELGKDAAHLLAEGLRAGTDSRARAITERIWTEALEHAAEPTGNLRAAIDSALGEHARNTAHSG